MVFLQTPPPWTGWLGAGILWRGRGRLTPSLALVAQKESGTLEAPISSCLLFFLSLFLFGCIFLSFLLGFSLFVLLRVRRSYARAGVWLATGRSVRRRQGVVGAQLGCSEGRLRGSAGGTER